MPRNPSGRTLFRATALLLGMTTIGGWGPFDTQASRIGPDDGTDACRPYLVALDAQGDYFGEDILKGAAMGGAAGGLAGLVFGRNLRSAVIGAVSGAVTGGVTGYWAALQQQSQDQAVLRGQVSGDLSRENGQIDKTQQAFDALSDCRYRQVQAVQADYKAKRIDRDAALARMQAIADRAGHDLEVARRLNGQIGERSQQFEVAAENIEPGSKAAMETKPAPRRAVVTKAVALKLRPDASSPDIATVPAKQAVQVGPSRGGYALVETSTGARGYAPVEAVQAKAVPVQAPAGDVRTLAGSNAARRDDFATSVTVTEKAYKDGFELAG